MAARLISVLDEVLTLAIDNELPQSRIDLCRWEDEGGRGRLLRGWSKISLVQPPRFFADPLFVLMRSKKFATEKSNPTTIEKFSSANRML